MAAHSRSCCFGEKEKGKAELEGSRRARACADELRDVATRCCCWEGVERRKVKGASCRPEEAMRCE